MPEPFCFHREGFRGSASSGTISLPTVHFGSISMSRVRYAEGECICLLLDEDAHFLSRKDVHESGVCANMRIYMRIDETPEDVKRWFRTATKNLWPIAAGSLSLRKSPCTRERCSLCESNKGHLSYVLYVKQGDRRFSLYVPDELADKIQQAIDNGRQLQDLIVEAGQRYTRALKTQRRSGKRP